MGQRLNIEILKDGKALANAYYHWSAYTSSSLSITKIILAHMTEVMEAYDDDVVRAVKLLETTGSGFTNVEVEYVMKHIDSFESYNFARCTSRNEGLTAISKEGMDETRRWEEGRVEIDLAKKTVNFKVYWEPSESDIEDMMQYDDLPDKLPEYDVSFTDIPFDKFADFMQLIERLVHDRVYCIKLKDSGKVISFIA